MNNANLTYSEKGEDWELSATAAFNDKQWQAELQLRHPAVVNLTAALLEFFKSQGGKNYVSMEFCDQNNPQDRYTLVVQKNGGISPGEKLARAEAEIIRALQVAAEMIVGECPFCKAQPSFHSERCPIGRALRWS